MAVLLDTRVVLQMLALEKAAEGPWSDELLHVSVASLWEIAIKVQQAKLETPVGVARLEERMDDVGWTVIPVQASHATAEVDPWPATQDPFDRLLLAVCQVEGLRLVTRDRKLVSHPLAWRPGSA